MTDYRSEAAARFPYQQTDHMAWAKRIIYREERKDSNVTPIQVDFAKRALGLSDKPKQP